MRPEAASATPGVIRAADQIVAHAEERAGLPDFMLVVLGEVARVFVPVFDHD
jgi:hypothetical protein